MKHEWVKDILERFQDTVPVDLEGLASALGLAVWAEDDLEEGVSGRIFKDNEHGGSAGYSIGVRSSDPYTRQRFTIAHEIAHFLLHRDKIGDCLQDDALYRNGLSTWDEVDANRLAAEILMPASLLQHEISKYNTTDAGFLAKLFSVLEQAMRIRMSD